MANDSYPPLQRNQLLYVSSVILIIWSALKLAGILLALFGFNLVLGIFGVGGIVGGVAAAIAVYASLSSILDLVAGLLGLRGSFDPARARICFVIGIIMLGLAVIGMFLGQVTFWNVVGLALPAAYTIGAWQVKSAPK